MSRTVSRQFGSQSVISRTSDNGGGGVSGVEISLLWENSSPTASFTAQNVSINLTDYDAILVIYRHFESSNSVGLGSMFCLKNQKTSLLVISPTNNRNGTRQVTPVDAEVQFTACRYNDGNQNNYGVPLYIYGIKF